MTSNLSSSCDLTIVIPVYNRSAELVRALDSLVDQTSKNFAVIVCDDGSSEDISAVTQLYSKTLDIQLLRIDNSGGPARPRNIALAAAHSTWISFLDSDDWWFPCRMERILGMLDAHFDLIYHQLQIVRSDESALTNPRQEMVLGDSLRANDPLMHLIRFGNPFPTSATTVRRDKMLAIGGFSESLTVEDFDAWFRLCYSGLRIKFVPEVLGAYWNSTDQISTFNISQYQRQQNLFARQLELMPPHYRIHAQSNFSYLLGSYEIALGMNGAALHFRNISIRLEPLRWLKAWFKLVRAYVRSLVL